MGPLDSSLIGTIEAPDMETVERLQRLLLETFATLRRDGLRASEPVWKDSQEVRQQAFGVAEVLEFTASVGSELMADVLRDYLHRELRKRWPEEAAAVHAEHCAVTVRLLESTVVVRLSNSSSPDERCYS
jgi:hypothetical protein